MIEIPVCPYKGPKPLEPGDTVFGRRTEIQNLYDRIVSSRIVLLHSPSGAGKTSLVQAGLLPILKDDFTVWGPTRVNEPCPSPNTNRFSYSAIRGLDTSGANASVALQDYVSSRRTSRRPLLLIFDQFEEVLTADPGNRKAIQDFFAQLGALLHDPSIFALFMIREDYLAPLDPYRRLVPTYFNNRFRIDYPDLKAARELIAGPAASVKYPFTSEAVNQLAWDLSNAEGAMPPAASRGDDDDSDAEMGLFVEPIFLQIVCADIWVKLLKQTGRTKPNIDLDDVQSLSNVSYALGAFYESHVEAISSGDTRLESDIRDWFGNKLITAQAHRNQVLRSDTETEGLDNAIVDKLEASGLLRRSLRSRQFWFELAHDRFIAAVTSSNQFWNNRRSDLDRAAERWVRNGRQDRFLVVGEDLAKLQSSADTIKLDTDARAFLTACHALEVEQIQKAKDASRLRSIGIAMAILFGMSSGATLASYWFIASRTNLWPSYWPYILIANLIGGLSAFPILLVFRNDQRMLELLQKFTRKHRMDPSLQSIPVQFNPASYQAPVLDGSTVLDQFDRDTLNYVPFWIFIIVAGSDGWIASREVRHFFRDLRRGKHAVPEEVVDAFVRDPRPATVGLSHAAMILNRKMTAESASSFRETMRSLASGISKIGSEVGKSLDYISAALAGEDLATRRPGIYRYYRNSGIYSQAGIAVGIVGATFAALILDWIYYYVHASFSNASGFLVTSLQAFIALIYGLLFAAAFFAMSIFTNTRNQASLFWIALTSSLIALYARWAATFGILYPSEWLPVLTGLATRPGFASNLALAIGEALLIVGPALLISCIDQTEAYCEGCGTWADRVDDVILFASDPSLTAETITTHLEQGDLTIFKDLIIPPSATKNAELWYAFSLESCPGCNNFFVLTVHEVFPVPDGTDRNTIVDQLLINRRMANWLQNHAAVDKT